ncbi:MAG: sugar transferase [Candidatus Omnitrophica bacterium]|nr:sugar transferase [Candidatus Omnitrophota bacterium]
MLKRIFDIVFSLLVIFICLPVFILASLLVKLDSGSPIFFKQKRVGKNGKVFTIFKFRTMKTKGGPLITAIDDSRITKAGKILRFTNFDELPQFFNIIKGDMSIVGPRPELPEIVKIYTPKQREILKFKPGFTSFSTVKFLDEEKMLVNKNIMEFYLNEILPKKIDADLEYFQKSNLFSDFILILKTIGKTFIK